MDIKSLKTDNTREDEGVWAPFGADCELKLARIGNRKYRQEMQRRLKPHRRALRTGAMPEDTLEQITAEVLAETVLLDWRGLQFDSADVPYSVDKAKEFLTDPELKDFRDLVVEMAGDLELFRQQEIEEAAKNSVKSSPGKSTGAAK